LLTKKSAAVNVLWQSLSRTADDCRRRSRPYGLGLVITSSCTCVKPARRPQSPRSCSRAPSGKSVCTLHLADARIWLRMKGSPKVTRLVIIVPFQGHRAGCTGLPGEPLNNLLQRSPRSRGIVSALYHACLGGMR